MIALQDIKEDMDLVKIEKMRSRARERTKRFMNSRLRMMGIDNEYLHRQVEEKRRAKQIEQEEEHKEARNIQKQIEFLENKELESMEIKAKQIEDLRKTLTQQVADPKNNALAKNGPINLDECGVASVQVFEGEDRSYNERRLQKQAELRKWTNNQLKEKRALLQSERDDKENYDSKVIEQDIRSCALAAQEEERKAKINREISSDNISRFKEKKLKEKAEKELKVRDDLIQANYFVTNPFLSEDVQIAKNCIAPHRYRPDHFKGLGKNQKDMIIQGNANVLAEKKKLILQQDLLEREWAQQQKEQLESMVKEENMKKQARRDLMKIQMGELQQQRREFKEKQDKMRQERFGEITDGFFQGFGTSCR